MITYEGHGGNGGAQTTGVSGNPYGSYIYPSLPGSRGGVFSSVGYGGGVITIHAVDVIINGSLLSDGVAGAFGSGGGSGGTFFFPITSISILTIDSIRFNIDDHIFSEGHRYYFIKRR